jgi:hypothetical protein
VTVQVPAFTASGRLMFGARDGLWLCDLAARSLTRLADTRGVISDLSADNIEASSVAASWVYVDRPDEDSWSGNPDFSSGTLEVGNQIVPVADPVPVQSFAVSPYDVTDLVLANGTIYFTVSDGQGTVLEPVPGANRIRYTPANNQVCIAGPSGIVHGPVRSPTTSIVTWSGKAKAAAIDLHTSMDSISMGVVLLWIDPDQGGLYRAEPLAPQQSFAARDFVRVCDAKLADGCWGLSADPQLNFIYWFEDDPSGYVALCRYDVRGKTRATLFLVEPAHRPVGGGLVAF